MRWQAILSIVVIAAVLFWVYRYNWGPDLEVEEQSREKVRQLWARPLPWFPSLDSLTGAHKTSPDGVNMPTGWDGL